MKDVKTLKSLYLSAARVCMLVAIALLSSCGSGGTSSPNNVVEPPAQVPPQGGDNSNIDDGELQPEYLGFVRFDKSTATRTNGDAQFGMVSEGIARLNLAYLEDDVCFVSGETRPMVDVGDVQIAGPFLGFDPLDAGGQVFIRGDGTRVERLDKGSRDNLYRAFIDRPLDSNLSLDIRGNEFPAAEPIPVPVAPPALNQADVILTPSPDEAVTIDTEFTWMVVDGTEDSRLVIELSQFGADPEINIECYVANDGEFSFSENMKTGFRRLEQPYSVMSSAVFYKYENTLVSSFQGGQVKVVVSHSTSYSEPN